MKKSDELTSNSASTGTTESPTEDMRTITVQVNVAY